MRPFDREHNQRARQSLAEHGIEMTPDQLIAERKAAYAAIRHGLQAKGFRVPDSDEELFLLIQKVLKERGEKR